MAAARAKPPAGVPLDPTDPLARGLVAFWPLREGAGAGASVRDAVSGQVATLVNAPAWIASDSGPSLLFDGSTQYATTTATTAGALTFAALMKPNGATGFAYAIGESAHFKGLRFPATNTPSLCDGSGDLTAPSALPASAWSLVVGTLDGTTQRLYVGGVQVASGASTAVGIPASNLQIVGTSGANLAPVGIAAVWLWGRALSPGEVADLAADPWRLLPDFEGWRYASAGGGGAQAITPSGIASAESFGTTVVAAGAVAVLPAGIGSAEAFGTAIVAAGAVGIAPGGIASLESFGTAIVSLAGAQSIAPAGIGSLESFGTAVLLASNAIAPAGIASLESFGTATIAPGAVSILPAGISSAEAFGTTVVAVLGGDPPVSWPFLVPFLATRRRRPGAIPPPTTILEQALVARAMGSTALVALVGVRFEPHNVPEGDNDEPSYPCVVYRVLEDLHDYHLDGETTIARAIVRFQAKSRDFADCVAIAEAMRNLFSGFRGTVGSVVFFFSKLVPPGQDSDYDPNDDSSDLGAHKKSFDYKFTYRVTVPTLN